MVAHEYRTPRIADDEEVCARCGDVMPHGSFVVDVDTDPNTMPYATAEWATVHRKCVEYTKQGGAE